jgi:hypothetical protein
MPIDGFAVLLLIWAGGTAIQAPRVLKRWSKITTCDPLELCDGCRDERKRVMLHADEWEFLGSFGGPVMVVLEAAGWYMEPFVPAIRKSAGKEPHPKCSKGQCVAYGHREASE